MSAETLTLDAEEVRAIRKAMLIGLDSYGEIERLSNQADCNDIPEEWKPIHPTGSSETIGQFATALRYLEG
jgi:hypothetical protein